LSKGLKGAMLSQEGREEPHRQEEEQVQGPRVTCWGVGGWSGEVLEELVCSQVRSWEATAAPSRG
jgi:hypothetical protein